MVERVLDGITVRIRADTQSLVADLEQARQETDQVSQEATQSIRSEANRIVSETEAQNQANRLSSENQFRTIIDDISRNAETDLQVKVDNTLSQLRSEAETIVQSATSTISQAAQGAGGGGGGFLSGLGGGIFSQVTGFITGRIRSLVSSTVTDLLEGSGSTDVSVTSRGGGSQFTQNRSVTSSGNITSQSQQSSTLAGAVRSGDRNK